MKNIEYYKEKYFEKNPNSLIKILSKEGRFIYFETEFGLCKQPTDTFLLSKHLRTLSCAVNKNDYLSKIIDKLYNSNYDCSLIDYKGTNNTVTLICKNYKDLEIIGNSWEEGDTYTIDITELSMIVYTIYTFN